MIYDLLRQAARKMNRFPHLIHNAYLANKVRRNKRERVESYLTQPTVTAILQFFNKKQNVHRLVRGLRQSGVQEVIVIDDGSVDGSWREWVRQLTGPNDFLLRCNDIYEVRTYDRAIRMARGKFVCLLQDDDWMPNGDDWVKQALHLFDRFPNLLILGGRNGIDLLTPDPVLSAEGAAQYQRTGNVAGCPGVNKYTIHAKPSYVDPSTRQPFMFAMAINRAPMFLRRDQFLSLGGINQLFAPFQCDEVDACIRVWLEGYEVGLYECPFVRDVGTGGMRLFNSAKGIQIKKNWELIYRLWGAHIASGQLQKLVDKANAMLVPNA